MSAIERRMGSLRRGLSLPGLWALVSVALPALDAFTTRLPTVDLAYHLRAGDLILARRSFLRMDEFTFTAAGHPWVDQQWAAQVVLSLVARAGGWLALAITWALLLSLISLLVFIACREAGQDARRAAFLTVGSFLVYMPVIALRPQLLGMALFALTVLLIAGRHRHPGRAAVVPAVALVWANVHGSFVLAPILLTLGLVEDLRERNAPRRTFGLLVVTVTATLVNPLGPAAWRYVADVATNETIRRTIVEWQSPSVTTFAGAAFFLSGLAVVSLLVLKRRRLSWPTLLTFACFFAIGLLAVRGIAWWALVAPVTIARVLEPRARSHGQRSLVNTGIAAALIATGVVAAARWAGQPFRSPSPDLVLDAPNGIVAAVRTAAGPGDRLFTAQRWGSWFELILPEMPVFVDSRIEALPRLVWDDYFDVSSGRDGWQEILDRWRVDIVAVDPESQRPLLPTIQRDPRWRLIYKDNDGLVFVRARSLPA